jgi:putative ABC transport system permease protein
MAFPGSPSRVLFIAFKPAVAIAALVFVVPALAGPAAAGAAPADTREVGEILLSERAADALEVSVGDTIEASAQATFGAPELYRVAGVYRPRADPVEVGKDTRFVRMHADDLERLVGPYDQVQRIVLRLRDPSRAAEVRDRLNRTRLGYDAYTSQDLATRTSGTFVVISRFQRAIAWFTLVAGAIFLVTLMVLKIEERRREFQALRLLGLSRRTIVASLVLESVVVALLGAAGGVVLGLLASAGINAYFQRYYRTDLVFSSVTPDVALVAVSISVPLGILAAVVAVWRLLGSRSLLRGAR